MLGLVLASKTNFFHSFFEVPIFYRFWSVLERFWEGLGRVWEGFGEGLGKVWGRFGEAFGLILGSKMMFGDQSGAGMFKKCLGTFV